MATLNPSIFFQAQPYKAPNLDFSDTMVSIAKLKAYQQDQRLQELKFGQTERQIARDEEFDRLAAGLFTPSQPAAAPPQRGLAGGPSGAADGPPPPASPTMGGQDPLSMDRPPLASAAAPMPFGGGPQDSVAMNSPRGLADVGGGGGGVAAPAASPQPRAPAGLGGAQPGAPTSLYQPVNQQVLMRLYAANPERAGKLFEGHIKMQEQRLKNTEDMNTQIYQALSALQRSPDPAKYYPMVLKDLKEQGIPIPDSFPQEYDAGLIAFKLKEHETLKNRIDLSTIELNREKALQARLEGEKAASERDIKKAELPFVGPQKKEELKATQALTGQRQAETDIKKAELPFVGREKEAGIGEKEAQKAQRIAETARTKVLQGIDITTEERNVLAGAEDLQTKQQTRTFAAAKEKHDKTMRPLLERKQTLENEKAELDRDYTKTAEQRAAEQARITNELKNIEIQQKKAGVTPYTGDADIDTAISQVQQEAKEEGPPSPKTLAGARRLIIEGRKEVAASHGKDAAEQGAIKSVMDSASARGLAGEQVHETLEEMEDLIEQGTLSNTPTDAWRVYAQRLGFRPQDNEAARTMVLKSLGDRLTLALAGGKLGGNVSENDVKLIARATGDFGRLMSPAEQREALRSLRRRADQDMEFANRTFKNHKETKPIEFGGEHRERMAKTLTPEKLADALTAKPNWKREQAIAYYRSQGWRIRLGGGD